MARPPPARIPPLEDRLLPVRRRLVEMGRRVEGMIRSTLRSLQESDPELARKTIARDRKVNQDEIDIDEQVLAFLSEGGLSAACARFLLFATKVVVDLERIGDLAVNISELLAEAEEQGVAGDIDGIVRMGEVADSMVSQALAAFMEGDVAAARAVIERDDVVDRAYEALFRATLDRISRNLGPPELVIPEQVIARQIERMADHATNIAEQVILMLEARDVRHPGNRLR